MGMIKELIIAYLLIGCLITMTIGIILIDAYKLRKAILLIALYPLWVSIYIGYIVLGVVVALIKDMTIEEAFEVVEQKLNVIKLIESLFN